MKSLLFSGSFVNNSLQFALGSVLLYSFFNWLSMTKDGKNLLKFLFVFNIFYDVCNGFHPFNHIVRHLYFKFILN